MAKNFRVDAELIKSVRGYAGIMYSARIPQADRAALDVNEGVANGTLLSVGALETGEREIRVAGKPVVTELPYVVIRGEVNAAQYVKTDDLWGKFRIKADKPLPVAKLSVGDFLGYSEDYFTTANANAIAEGQKFVMASSYVAGSQFTKKDTPAAGEVVFEVVEVKANHIPTYLMSDGNLTKPYKMITLEVKIA